MANVLFAGVGGQGVVTASDLLAHAALRAGWNVKKAETHGMAQRGGSVVTHVRVSPDQPVHSPLIPHGCADYLIALELLEGVRTLWMLAPGGQVIADARRIPPITVTSGAATYPDGLEDQLRSRGRVLPATEEATRMGDARAANALLLGALGRDLGLPEDAWQSAFAAVLNPKALDLNWRTFLKGASGR
ncbi:MAG TPA: indolepyruvate oxidoreductase subunit beta [Armatimonadota bacterium]|nr:indolepyruvate oxidoreductase subunit beta [Armatimonadota bacterium]